MPMIDRENGGGPATGPLGGRMAQHQGQVRYANGPNVIPGTTASDFKWNPDSLQWELNPQARPGYVYVGPNADASKSGHSGWIPTADANNDPTGLFHGWTKGQLLALAGIGGAAVAPALIGAIGGGGAGAGAAGAEAGASAGAGAAGAAVPSIATTAGLGATIPGTAVASGFGGAGAAGAAGAGTLASTSLAGAGTLPAAAGAGNLAGGVGTAASGGLMSTLAKPSTLQGIQAASGALSGAAKGAADARAQQAAQQAQQDRTAIDRYSAQQNANTQNANLDLAQRQFGLSAPKARAGTMVQGDIISTLQKVSGQHGKFNFMSGAPTLSDATRSGGQAMTKDAVMAQLAGDHFAPIQTVPVPGATPLPQASLLEKLGGLAGIIGGAAGAYNLYNGNGASGLTQGASVPRGGK